MPYKDKAKAAEQSKAWAKSEAGRAYYREYRKQWYAKNIEQARAQARGYERKRLSLLAAGEVEQIESKTTEYRTWINMRIRCYDRSCDMYHNYGGRGITVCDRWRESFANFLEDMGRKPGRLYEIDRINNDGNYEPGNCRWATRKQNIRNTRVNRMLTLNGVTKCAAEWAEELGLSYQMIMKRLERGHSDASALTLPRMGNGYTKESRLRRIS